MTYIGMVAMLVYCSAFSTTITFILKIGSISSSTLSLHSVVAVYNMCLLNEINVDATHMTFMY